MTITQREITRDELQMIYDDFKKIEIADGVPQQEEERYQFTAEENGEVIGFVSGLTKYRWFYLTDMWVDERYRRQGLGSKLLKMMEDKVTANGMEHIYLWTSGRINPFFYEKHGYQSFVIFENFYELEGYHHMGYRKDFNGLEKTKINERTYVYHK